MSVNRLIVNLLLSLLLSVRPWRVFNSLRAIYSMAVWENIAGTLWSLFQTWELRYRIPGAVSKFRRPERLPVNLEAHSRRSCMADKNWEHISVLKATKHAWSLPYYHMTLLCGSCNAYAMMMKWTQLCRPYVVAWYPRLLAQRLFYIVRVPSRSPSPLCIWTTTVLHMQIAWHEYARFIWASGLSLNTCCLVQQRSPSNIFRMDFNLMLLSL